MSRIRPVLLAAVVAGLSIGVAACGSDSTTAQRQQWWGRGDARSHDRRPVPLTGDLSDFGPPGDKAANLAVDKINAAIQQVGADHTVDARRPRTTADLLTRAASQAARKLVESDGASCIAGAWASSGHDPGRPLGVDPARACC